MIQITVQHITRQTITLPGYSHFVRYYLMKRTVIAYLCNAKECPVSSTICQCSLSDRSRGHHQHLVKTRCSQRPRLPLIIMPTQPFHPHLSKHRQ